MDTFTSTDLKSLADLLNLEKNTDSEDEKYGNNATRDSSDQYLLAPGTSSLQNKMTETEKRSEMIKHDYKNIWSDDEVLDEEDDEAKTKKTPEYEVTYQQSVTPDDVFLQISGKGPGSDSCECLLVKIKLSGIHSKDEVTLNISALKLVCKTKQHYLNLDLPKQVDPIKCSAEWDPLKHLLVVKLHFDANCKLNM